MIVFVADGMRQYTMKRLVAEGKMPTYQDLLDTGVDAGKGLIPVVPATSPPNWITFATGTSPSVHGATNTFFYDNTRPFRGRPLSGFTSLHHDGENIVERAEASGLTAVVLAWKSFKHTTVQQGAALNAMPLVLPGMARGIVANYEVPGVRPEYLELFGWFPKLTYDRVILAPAADWAGVPGSFSPPRETAFAVNSQQAYQVYVYDSTDDAVVNYDRVLISPSRDAAAKVAELAPGQWSGSISASLAWSEYKFYAKVLDLSPDLSRFRLYFTAPTRVDAYPLSLEKHLASEFDGVVMWYDLGPYAAGLVDADTLYEQFMLWDHVVAGQMFPYIVESYAPDLVMAGTPLPDAIQHLVLAQAVPGTAVHDPVVAPIARGFIERIYVAADQTLAGLMTLLPSANVIATSDHGFSPAWLAINSQLVLQKIGLFDPLDPAHSQAVPAVGDACVQVYINLEGRNPGGIVLAAQYQEVRQQIVDAFVDLGPAVVERVLLKEQTDHITTTLGVTMNMLHPDRTGDVVVFAAPPYVFELPDPNSVIGPTVNRGAHAYIPNGQDERFAAFAAAGPDISRGRMISPVTALDIVPTVAFALGIDPPAAEGRILPIFRTNSVFLPLAWK